MYLICPVNVSCFKRFLIAHTEMFENRLDAVFLYGYCKIIGIHEIAVLYIQYNVFSTVIS